MSEYRPNDEIQEQAERGLQSAGRTVANRAKNAARNTAKKAAKSTASKLATKGIGAILKSIGGALLTLLAPLIPYAVGLLAVTVALASLFGAWRNQTYDDPAQSGAFQVESSNQYNVVTQNGTTIENIQTSLGNDMAGIFYTKYAKEGYFYTLDDNPTIIQGDLTKEIKDFEGRESIFLLSPQMLMALDNGLNDGYKIPEQFIKPVYNTCMIEDESLRSTNGYCSLLNLFKDGKLVPKGSAYVGKYYSATDEKPEGVHSSFSGYLYVKSENKTPSVYDWGLAPIFHYKSFVEESRVSNYRIAEVEIYNEATRRKETRKFHELSDEERALFPSVPETFGAGSAEDSDKRLPSATKKYAIDNVVSFLGTIRNEIKQEWVSQGVFKKTDYLSKKYYHLATQEEMENPSIKKRVTYDVGFGAEKISVDVVRITGELPDGKEQYSVTSYGETIIVNGVTSVEIEKTVKLAYVKEGTVELNTVRYADSQPNTDGIVGTQYLSDYIDAYQTYAPVSGGAGLFACYSLDWPLTVQYDDTNNREITKKLELDWNRVDDNSQFSFIEASRLPDLVRGSTPKSFVASPSQCKNDQIAMSLNEGLMDKFYFDEMPNMHYLAIAKLLNYKLSTNDRGQLVLDTTLSTLRDISKPSYTTHMKNLDTLRLRYQDDVTLHSKAYGVDENLMWAIILASSESGYGPMKAKRVDDSSSSIVVYNYTNLASETIEIDENRLISDTSYNIKVGAANIQYLMKKYNSNMLLALQAYTSSVQPTDVLANDIAVKPSSMKDVRWTAIRSQLPGDPQFLEKVLSNSVNSQFDFILNNTQASIDISFLYTVKGSSTTVAIKNLNHYLLEQYFTNDSLNLENIWDILYLGQKSYDSSKYASVGAGYLIDTKSMSAIDKERIIQSVFAFSEGLPIENYENMSDAYWRAKAGSLFMNYGSSEVRVFYNPFEHMSGSLSGVVPYNIHLVATRPYGTFIDEIGRTEAHDDVEFQTVVNGNVLSITDGTIVSVVRGRDGKSSSITIAPPAVHKEEGGVKSVEYQSQIYYTNLGSINSTLKRGDKIEAGTVVGTVSRENQNKFNLSYYVNGDNMDSQLILDYVEYLLIESSSHAGSGKMTSNKAWVDGLASVDLSQVEFNGSREWFSPVQGRDYPNAGTWSYDYGLGRRTHDAVDIGSPIGTPILALGDGVILDYRDSSFDYSNPKDPRNVTHPNPINSVLFVMKKDGFVYTGWAAHVQQNSVQKSSYTFKEGDIIARVGNNGTSTGPHLHLSMINHGSNKTVQEIVETYRDNPGVRNFGINPRENAYERCENRPGVYPCGVAIDKVIFPGYSN